MRTTSLRSQRSDLARQLYVASAGLSRRLRQEADSGLTPGLMSALATIQAHGPMTPSELAASERVARPGVTRVIARLESNGLVTTTPDPRDRRSYTISINPSGTALLRATRRRSQAFLASALRSLDDADAATLASAIAVLNRILEDTRSTRR